MQPESGKKQTFKVWDFMGYLIHKSDLFDGSGPSTNASSAAASIVTTNVNENATFSYNNGLLCCKLCFNEQCSQPKGRLQSVYCASPTTVTGNHFAQATAAHGKVFSKPSDAKITG